MLNIFSKKKSENLADLIFPIAKQSKAWRTANRKMAWGIPLLEFDQIEVQLELTEDDRRQGFIGVILSHGFGDDGYGNSDPVLFLLKSVHKP